MNIKCQHNKVSMSDILTNMKYEYLIPYFNKDININKNIEVENLSFNIVSIGSDINCVYVLSSMKSLENDTKLCNIRYKIDLYDSMGKKAGNNCDTLCSEITIDDTVYVLSVIDISEPLNIQDCTIYISKIRRNKKTLVTSDQNITSISKGYVLPKPNSSSFQLSILDCSIKDKDLEISYFVEPYNNENNYNLLLSVGCKETPLLVATIKNNPLPLLEYSKYGDTNMFYCKYDLSNLSNEQLANIHLKYEITTIEISDCKIDIPFDLRNGLVGIAHLIKVEQAININNKMFNVKEFRIGNITTRIIIDGSLLSISDSIDNLINIYNGNTKLDLLSAKCTSKKTVYDFKTFISSSNKLTVKIADTVF